MRHTQRQKKNAPQILLVLYEKCVKLSYGFVTLLDYLSYAVDRMTLTSTLYAFVSQQISLSLLCDEFD